jgi:hypothetical protein
MGGVRRSRNRRNIGKQITDREEDEEGNCHTKLNSNV